MEKRSALDLFKLFAALIFISSALLTFAFFFDHLPNIVPPTLLDAFLAALVAGLLGLLIFDGGALAWLKVYLSGSENNDQRTIAIQTSILDIAGSAIASFVQLILTGRSLVTITENERFIIGWVALVATAGVLVWNFVAIWRFHKNSNSNKDAIREADRLGKIRDEEDKQADALDLLIAKKVGEKLTAISEGLAEEQADRIVASRRRIEERRYQEPITSLPADTPVAKPNGVPKRDSSQNFH